MWAGWLFALCYCLAQLGPIAWPSRSRVHGGAYESLISEEGEDGEVRGECLAPAGDALARQQQVDVPIDSDACTSAISTTEQDNNADTCERLTVSVEEEDER